MSRRKIIICVLGLPIRKNGKGIEFLLTRRCSPQNKNLHNKWQLAGGGLEFGEDPKQTMIREFEEELSVTPEIIHNLPIVFANTWESSSDFKSSVHIVLITYLVSINNQTPKITDPDEETNDINWFTAKEINDLEVLPKTIEFISEANKIISTNRLFS